MNSVETANKQLINDFMEVFSSGDLDNALACMSDSATWWVGGNLEGLSGEMNMTQLRTLLTGLGQLTTTGAIKLIPHAMTAEGNRVAVETESYTELKNGRVYNNLYHFLFEIQDGKIQKTKEYLDTEHTRAIFLAP